MKSSLCSIILSLFVANFIISFCFPLASAQTVTKNNFNILTRPDKDKYIFDYAQILKDAEEYSNRYLDDIRKKYSIEAVIVSVPSLEGKKNIEEFAVELFNNWKIGKGYNARGILLLLADQEKQAKLEVSYELEDVFTDGFCGYIQSISTKAVFFKWPDWYWFTGSYGRDRESRSD